MQDDKRKNRKVAVVVKKSGDKTVKVAIDYKVKHPLYGKYIRKRTSLRVHDQDNAANEGDLVQVQECRPFSKTKSWRLVKVLETAGEREQKSTTIDVER
jgi:small subunit ribosomal protein S17